MSLIYPEKIKLSLRHLEQEIHEWLEPTKIQQKPYEVSLDFESHRFDLQVQDRTEFLILLFSRMANYFEKGFLLEGISSDKSLPQWACSLNFSNGELYVADPSLQVNFPIPAMGLQSVLRNQADHWGPQEGLWTHLLPRDSEWTALIFCPSPELRFLFFTRLAEPWLKTQTENAHKFIITALADLP